MPVAHHVESRGIFNLESRRRVAQGDRRARLDTAGWVWLPRPPPLRLSIAILIKTRPRRRQYIVSPCLDCNRYTHDKSQIRKLLSRAHRRQSRLKPPANCSSGATLPPRYTKGERLTKLTIDTRQAARSAKPQSHSALFMRSSSAAIFAFSNAPFQNSRLAR